MPSGHSFRRHLYGFAHPVFSNLKPAAPYPATAPMPRLSELL
ncbi:hypothetical protein [Neisseria meningitidis]|nr:hypothetical protein [Neisseria meningitidis]